ncbi:MAG: NYN domain-containing protein [Streptosporangiaceae bacterium]
MESACLVLVDGWNHYLAAQRCFGTEMARKFPVDRLAWHAAAAAGEETLADVIVLMALPEPEQQGDTAEGHAWRRKCRKLSNYGVQRPKNVRFSYHDTMCAGGGHPLPRTFKCPECGTLNHMTGRRKEKGADVKLATLAVNGAWTREYSSLVIFSQDTDFGPLISQLREIHLAQGRRYNLYSAYPDCGGAAHAHRGVPGSRPLPLAADTYAELAAQPSRHVHPVTAPAT